MESAKTISIDLQTQSLNAIVMGFSFAAALSWLDVVRWVINNIIKVQKNSGANYLLTALFTTLLSVLVYIIFLRLSKKTEKVPTSSAYSMYR